MVNTENYDKSEVLLCIIVIGFLIFLSITILGIILDISELIKKILLIFNIILAAALFFLYYLSNTYMEEYKKEAYKQCENYIKLKYNAEIIEYDKLSSSKGSVYVRGGSVSIKTYYYDDNKLYYVEYEFDSNGEGIILYQTAFRHRIKK
jgi:hypothetical protein